MKTALVTGGTSKDIAAIATFIINIKEKLSDSITEVVVFHDGINRKDMAILHDIFPSRFLSYRFPIRKKWTNEYISKYFSEMVFCKIECFRLLNDYDKIIWSDYDVVVLDDLDAELSESTNGVTLLNTDNKKVSDQFIEDCSLLEDQYDLERDAISLALFILERRTCKDYMTYYNFCIDNIIKYESILRLPEQAIFELLLQEYDIKVRKLDFNVYALHPRNYMLNSEAKILHAYGPKKFWSGIYNGYWFSRYNQWLSLGGTSFDKPQKKRIRYTIKSWFISYIKRELERKEKKCENEKKETLLQNFYSIGANSNIEFPERLIVGNNRISIGENFTARTGLYLGVYESDFTIDDIIIWIGNNVIINYDCIITATNRLIIGNDVLMASRIYISDHSHGEISTNSILETPINRDLYSKGPVIIGDRVWLGSDSVILPGVEIGEDSIVGANSVVTKSFPPRSVIAGNPAKLIKKLED